MTTRRHVGTIPGVPARRSVAVKVRKSTHGRRNCFARMASALKNRGIGRARSQWAPIGL